MCLGQNTQPPKHSSNVTMLIPSVSNGAEQMNSHLVACSPFIYPVCCTNRWFLFYVCPIVKNWEILHYKTLWSNPKLPFHFLSHHYLLLHSCPMPFLITWIYVICVSPFSCPESPSSSSLMGGFLSDMFQTSPHLRTHFLHRTSLLASLVPRALTVLYFLTPSQTIS